MIFNDKEDMQFQSQLDLLRLRLKQQATNKKVQKDIEVVSEGTAAII